MIVPRNEVIEGNVIDVLRSLPTNSIDAVLTSPPYYGLRDYGKQNNIVWGGKSDCVHQFEKSSQKNYGGGVDSDLMQSHPRVKETHYSVSSYTCSLCGAWKGQLGLEPHPQMFIDHLVQIFREIKRVLKPTGSCWIVIGDTYYGGGGGHQYSPENQGLTAKAFRANKDKEEKCGIDYGFRKKHKSNWLQAKQKLLIPERFAVAMQEDTQRLIPLSEDRAWLAALIDGEGCIGIRKQDIEDNRALFSVYLSIAMTDKSVLDKCVQVTGLGSVRVKNCGNQCDKRNIRTVRTVYQWRLDGPQAVDVVTEVFPFLIAKKKQAQVAYTLQQSLKFGRGEDSKSAEMESRFALWIAIKALNQRKEIILPSLLTPNIAFKKDGWILRNTLIWNKLNPMPSSARDRLTNAYESIFFFTKEPRYFFDLNAIRKQYPESTLARLKRAYVGNNKVYNDNFSSEKHKNFAKRVEEGIVLGGNPGDVWSLTSESFKGAHYATFPQKLVKRILKAVAPRQVCVQCGKPRERITTRVNLSGLNQSKSYEASTDWIKHGTGKSTLHTELQIERNTVGWTDCGCGKNFQSGLVLDPFCGSGTTLLVAHKLGLDWLGIDINTKYCRMANKRLISHGKVRLDKFMVIEK